MGLVDSWGVDSVEVKMAEKRAAIRFTHQGEPLCCTECGKQGPQADLAPDRTWRHLDMSRFATEILARLPRITCQLRGGQTMEASWAGKLFRSTLLSDAFAIELLKASFTIRAAATLLRLDWDPLRTFRTGQ